MEVIIGIPPPPIHSERLSLHPLGTSFPPSTRNVFPSMHSERLSLHPLGTSFPPSYRDHFPSPLGTPQGTASLLEELGNSFSCDFSVDDSGGARLMAKILFQKFPKELKGEMIGLTGKRIPSLSAILELTSEAVKRLRVKGSASAASTFTTGQGSSQKTARRATVTSSFHVDSNNLTSAGYSRSLPPILLVTFFNGEKMVSVNCLLDTGSGRSYLSADVLRDLGSVETVGVSCRLRLFTLLGECDRNFTEVVLGVDLGSGEALASSVLVTDAMDLSVRLAHLETLLGAFRAADYNLAGQFEAGSDLVLIKGIIGLDLIHRLITLKLVPCLRGWAFSVPSGLVPFGTVDSFLSGDKIPCEVAHLSFNTVMGDTPEVNSSHLCFVLENQPTYLDPLAEFFPDSAVSFNVIQRDQSVYKNRQSFGLGSAREKNYYFRRRRRHSTYFPPPSLPSLPSITPPCRHLLLPRAAIYYSPMPPSITPPCRHLLLHHAAIYYSTMPSSITPPYLL
ncbi:unnamed protein product [Acanthosepion pharaonis]|uniref:Uncharacterized protein n=1 Tax=Acanthosepion pharaonis TaxID=158019 RepID=A0A812B217_ACAPH|nr:unnamed protein product [Sepia pharaonis]